MSWHPILTELRTVLATLYPAVDDARRVVVDAGLDPLRIAFDAKALTNWQHILEEALHSSRVDALLQVTRTEYASNPSLLQAIQAYQSIQTTPPLESTKTPINPITPPTLSLLKPADNPKPSAQASLVTVPEPSKTLAVLEHVLISHKLWVNSVAVSPDGKWVVSSAMGRKLRLWELATGKCLAILAGHYWDDANCVVITPDGQRVLSSSDDGKIRVWDVSNLLKEKLEQIEPESKFWFLRSSFVTLNSSMSWEAGFVRSLIMLSDGQHLFANGASGINL